MSDSIYPFHFEAEITTYDVGSERYIYTVIFLPEALHDDIPWHEATRGRLRVRGEINEMEFASALMPVPGDAVPGSHRDRRYYILLSKKQLRHLELGVDHTVRVRFGVDDQDAVQVPEVLAQALRQHGRMKKRWDALTPGKQRGLAYRVASAKRAETQSKRIKEVFKILEGKRDMRGKPI
ncbi:MAG: YdeI/OmpD-associated family protein [Planctomycetota bacterium]